MPPIFPAVPLPPDPLTPDPSIITYMTLRKAVGLLGLTLVPLLILGSFFLDCPQFSEFGKHIYISVSAYNYSHMRNALVGIVCTIALFLISYHGYSKLDSVISKFSGLFALVIVFVPTSESNIKGDPKSIVHYLAAAVFFVLLSFTSICLFTKSTAPVKTKQKKQRNGIYRCCGISMLVSVACIALDKIPFLKDHVPLFGETILFETIALTFFGVSWMVKGEFILKDKK